MPRKTLFQTDKCPYHITNRSNNKDFFYIPLGLLWAAMVEKIQYLEKNYEIRTHAFLLMSNHYHWILSTPKKNLSEGMTYFHREVAREANRISRRTNHFFGGRYKWSLITEEIYYWNCVKYVFRNPVKAGICKEVGDYSYSSLNDSTRPQLWHLSDFFNDPEKRVQLDIQWLNETFSAEQDNAIAKGLRRREFKIPKDRNRKTVELNERPAAVQKGTWYL